MHQEPGSELRCYSEGNLYYVRACPHHHQHASALLYNRQVDCHEHADQGRLGSRLLAHNQRFQRSRYNQLEEQVLGWSTSKGSAWSKLMLLPCVCACCPCMTVAAPGGRSAIGMASHSQQTTSGDAACEVNMILTGLNFCSNTRSWDELCRAAAHICRPTFTPNTSLSQLLRTAAACTELS
jgi:hypothetical protein